MLKAFLLVKQVNSTDLNALKYYNLACMRLCEEPPNVKQAALNLDEVVRICRTQKLDWWLDQKRLKCNIFKLITMIKELSSEPERLVADPKVRLPNVENLGNVNHKIMVPNLRELK